VYALFIILAFVIKQITIIQVLVFATTSGVFSIQDGKSYVLPSICLPGPLSAHTSHNVPKVLGWGVGGT